MELLVYKASAGSGKTFTLAVEYIRRLILNPRAYRQILAVTFTNKATAEMKERITQQLYGIWQADAASDAYFAHIRQTLAHVNPPLTDDDLRQRAGMAMLYLLHDYDRFRVETIDSFFQSVMRNLARELELSPNLDIELDNAKILDEAVDRLIEKLTPQSPVMNWLLDYINEYIAEDKSWNVTREIKHFGRKIFDEEYVERGEQLRLKLKVPGIVRLYRDALRALEHDSLERMKSFASRFYDILDAHQLSTDDLARKNSGIAGYFHKLASGKLVDKDLANATLDNCLNDAEAWVTKTSRRRNEILDIVHRELQPLLVKAEEARQTENTTVNSCRLSTAHLNQLQLLNHIADEVRQLNQEKNQFLLSDTTALVHKLVHVGDASFVFEKMGASIRNVMIDEFQDTSHMQWDNFRMLLAEGLAQGEDSLIVGDVKQSIYRWRNGDWNILNNIEHGELKRYVSVRSLNVNRRSEARIIHFNNALFPAIVDELNTRHSNELKEECLPLKQAYADVCQESPRAQENGYVKINLLPDDDTLTADEQILASLADEVNRLLEQGVQMNDIAILIRYKRHIAPIATYFDEVLHIPIVSNEAFRLQASQAVNLLIEALRYLYAPDNSIARASVITAYQQAVLGNPASPHALYAGQDDLLPADFTARQAELRLMPLHELLEELFVIFRIGDIPQQEAYLFAFFDAVTEYLQHNSSDLGQFLAYWDETLCNKAIPEGEIDGIRILSIHSSKGLEFHTVLIPYCNWEVEKNNKPLQVWCAPESEPYDALNLIPVDYSSVMSESIYRKDYLHERLQLWVDNLNLLYVAFTRPEKNLIVWSKRTRTASMFDLLSAVLPRIASADAGSWDESEGVFESGQLCPSISRQETQRMGNKLLTRPTALPVKMTSSKPDIEFRQSNRSADFIAGIEDEADSPYHFLNRGRTLHTLFSAIATPDDIESAVSRLVFEGIIDNQDEARQMQDFARQAFSLPQIREWYSGQWRLFRECDIIWMEDEQLHTRRPDRVMAKGDEMVVLDFKFGKPRQSHQKQVKQYMQLLHKMGYTDKRISGYLWYVDEERIEKVN